MGDIYRIYTQTYKDGTQISWITTTNTVPSRLLLFWRDGIFMVVHEQIEYIRILKKALRLCDLQHNHHIPIPHTTTQVHYVAHRTPIVTDRSILATFFARHFIWDWEAHRAFLLKEIDRVQNNRLHKLVSPTLLQSVA